MTDVEAFTAIYPDTVSIMFARGAIYNPSIFSRNTPPKDAVDCMKSVLNRSIGCGLGFHSSKFILEQMATKETKLKSRIADTRGMKGLCEIFDINECGSSRFESSPSPVAEDEACADNQTVVKHEVARSEASTTGDNGDEDVGAGQKRSIDSSNDEGQVKRSCIP